MAEAVVDKLVMDWRIVDRSMLEAVMRERWVEGRVVGVEAVAGSRMMKAVTFDGLMFE